MAVPKRIVDPIKEAEAFNERGVELAENGKYLEADRCYLMALKLDPSFKEAWFNKGELHRKQGDNSAAITCYTKALMIDPNFCEAWVSKGFAHTDRGDDDEAIDCYKKALDILRKIGERPKEVEEAYKNGILHLRNNQFDKAIVEFDKAIKISPNFAEAWFSKGRALFGQGMKGEALRCINKAMDLFGKQGNQAGLDEVEKWVRGVRKF